MADFREFLAREYWREHALEAAYAAWGLLVFLVLMIATFPYGQALSALLSPIGLKVSYRDERLSLPIGAELTEVRVVDAARAGGPPVLQGEVVKLAPTLGSFLLGRPGVRISADLYGGELRATVRRRRGGTEITFDAQELDLRRYRAFAQFGASLGGRLSGGGTVLLGGGTLEGDSGELEVSCKGVALRLGTGLPPITFSDIKGTLTLRGGVVELARLHGTGADGTLDAQGTLRLAPELQASTVELTFRLEPTARGRSRLGFLLGLLPHPPEVGAYTLRGPLVAPLVS